MAPAIRAQLRRVLLLLPLLLQRRAQLERRVQRREARRVEAAAPAVGNRRW